MPEGDRADGAAGVSTGPPMMVRSVERCIDIIDLLAKRRQPVSLGAISRAIDSPKSTTLTIVRTLVQRGLLAVDPATRHYQIGLGFARYTSDHPREVDLVELAAPLLEALARDTLETSTLARLEGDKVFNVCRFVGPQPLQLVVPIGIARELHATAGGKIFLAWMTDDQRREYLASHRLRKFTARTVTDPVALARRVAACRRSDLAGGRPDRRNRPGRAGNERRSARAAGASTRYRMKLTAPKLPSACAASTASRAAVACLGLWYNSALRRGESPRSTVVAPVGR